MLTCKQVSKALAETDYQDLPAWKRCMLRFHVTICFVCGKFNTIIMLFQDMARAFRRHEEDAITEKAPEQAKAKWARTIESNISAKDA